MRRLPLSRHFLFCNHPSRRMQHRQLCILQLHPLHRGPSGLRTQEPRVAMRRPVLHTAGTGYPFPNSWHQLTHHRRNLPERNAQRTSIHAARRRRTYHTHTPLLHLHLYRRLHPPYCSMTRNTMPLPPSTQAGGERFATFLRILSAGCRQPAVRKGKTS